MAERQRLADSGTRFDNNANPGNSRRQVMTDRRMRSIAIYLLLALLLGGLAPPDGLPRPASAELSDVVLIAQRGGFRPPVYRAPVYRAPVYRAPLVVRPNIIRPQVVRPPVTRPSITRILPPKLGIGIVPRLAFRPGGLGPRKVGVMPVLKQPAFKRQLALAPKVLSPKFARGIIATRSVQQTTGMRQTALAAARARQVAEARVLAVRSSITAGQMAAVGVRRVVANDNPGPGTGVRTLGTSNAIARVASGKKALIQKGNTFTLGTRARLVQNLENRVAVNQLEARAAGARANTPGLNKPKVRWDEGIKRFREIASGRIMAARNVFPRNLGFQGKNRIKVVPVGQVLSRLVDKGTKLNFDTPLGKGPTGGNFFSDRGQTAESRGLGAGQMNKDELLFRVVKPIPMRVGTAAEVRLTGSPGQGQQYWSIIPVRYLLKFGYIMPVDQ
jgi:hypothetical protein